MEKKSKFNRRKFLQLGAGGLATAGLGALGLNAWRFSDLKNCKAKNSLNVLQDGKVTFSKCQTCSNTLFTLMNNEFEYPKKTEAFALDPLAGGLLNRQYQCGMIWGSTLALGAESFRQYEDFDQALFMAMATSVHLVNSFVNRSCNINCSEIIGVDISKKADTMTFMLKSMPSGFLNMICMNLVDTWYPEAVQVTRERLNHTNVENAQAPKSCASEVVKRMGGNEEEQVMVAGFAGGIGCSGECCGALGAAIWFNTLCWCRENPDQSGYKNPGSKEILNKFAEMTKSEMLCRNISGQTFKSVEHISEYLNNRGCEKIIEVLSQV